MARFLTPLRSEQLAVDRFKLLEPLVYESDLLGCSVTAPRGFVTDFDSTPRWLPIVYAIVHGEANAAAVVHDFLYQTHKARNRLVSRREADSVFDEAMSASGPGIDPVSGWKRWLTWGGVRLGGSRAYASGPSRLRVLWDRRRVER